MLFYEKGFIFSFILFYLIYLTARDKNKNLLIVLASYVFYSMWDWRFLSLLLLSTLVDYVVSNQMVEGNQQRNKKLLMLSVVVNIGMLGIFKYFNFFVENFVLLFGNMGVTVSPFMIDVILPAGISFYTFQTLSYTIDVYWGKTKAEKSLINFAAYVAFFPQLVAGPIERASNLLVQINKKREILLSDFFVGLRLFGWGIFKKVVVADNLGKIVDQVFAQPASYDSVSLVIAVYAFAFQIYCDFSGYTDMARGLARMMGFNLSINFNLPYFSRNLTDFWRRWHMTLSNWIRDYVYIPMGGNREGEFRTYKNLIITMALCGLWHGAGFNYILWGVYNGVILALEKFLATTSLTRFWHNRSVFTRIFVNFHVICFGWILFRSEDMGHFFSYISSMLHNSVVVPSEILHMASLNELVAYLWETLFVGSKSHIILFTFYVIPLVMVQAWQNKDQDHFFEIKYNPVLKGSIYGLFFVGILLFGAEDGKQFIYFQF